jgi:NADH dehydrogenase
MCASSRIPHVVVIGAGFGGIHVCKALKGARAVVSLVDRQNYHLFQPLLYQVAGAALSPADVAYPIRRIFRGQKNVRVCLAEATRIDLAQGLVHFHEGSTHYDYLVLAAGATHSYFGHDEWRMEAPGLKSIEDAVEIRKRILLAFEEAEYESEESSRRSKLTFVIVGGGPTGVELAGVLKEIAVDTIKDDFQNVDTATARIVLIDASPRLLPTFDPRLSAVAERDLRRMGIEVILNTVVTQVDAHGVVIGDQRIDAQNVFWAAGVKASSLGQTMGLPVDRAGRVLVNPDLSVPHDERVFVIGDMAAAKDARTGSPVPGVAQAAIQEGRFVGTIIRRELSAKTIGPRSPFVYKDKGSMATLGKAKAVAQIGHLRFSGLAAWLMWSFVHVLFLVGFRNKVFVVLSWLWNYALSARGARLIVGPEPLAVRAFRETPPKEPTASEEILDLPEITAKHPAITQPVSGPRPPTGERPPSSPY